MQAETSKESLVRSWGISSRSHSSLRRQSKGVGGVRVKPRRMVLRSHDPF